MIKELLVATKNPGKFHEIVAALQGLQLKFQYLGDFEGVPDFQENGKTYEENAFGKAFFYSEHFGGTLTIADDSGIEVDALKGEMGVFTRRWGKGEKASDEEWVQYFLERMREFPDNRKARFVCVVAVAFEKDVRLFLASVEGEITKELEAPIKSGLPLSSCFRPEGSDRVYAALSTEEKSRISHRGKALAQARNYLQTLV